MYLYKFAHLYYKAHIQRLHWQRKNLHQDFQSVQVQFTYIEVLRYAQVLLLGILLLNKFPFRQIGMSSRFNICKFMPDFGRVTKSGILNFFLNKLQKNADEIYLG